MFNSDKDVLVLKTLAWLACHKLWRVLKSNLSREIKKRLFLANVKCVQLYGSTAWSIDKMLRKKLNACYTRILRNIHEHLVERKTDKPITVWNITNSFLKNLLQKNETHRALHPTS